MPEGWCKQYGPLPEGAAKKKAHLARAKVLPGDVMAARAAAAARATVPLRTRLTEAELT